MENFDNDNDVHSTKISFFTGIYGISVASPVLCYTLHTTFVFLTLDEANKQLLYHFTEEILNWRKVSN